MTEFLNYIDGALVPSVTGRRLDVIEPATGLVYGQIPDSGPADAAAAVQSAVRAFPAWAARPAQERSEILLRLAALIDAHAPELAALESQDSGKPVRLAAHVDIPRAAANFRFFATAILHAASESHDAGPHAFNYTLRRPFGAVVCISPWNLPLYLFSWKVAPALAAGNCVIGKPSEVTPATAARLGALCIEAGFPPGVFNIVHGRGGEIGAALCAHPDVKAISFTGGTETGAAIARVAAPQFKKLSLELGGKNPTIVFADCDYEETLQTAVRAAFQNQGEICLCGSRILIEKTIYNRFRDDFVARVQALRVGDPTEPDVDMGAIVSQAHYEKVLGYMELARAEGGRILCGGGPAPQAGRCAQGWFLQPTVAENLPNTCRTNQEEIFGPLVTLQSFENETEALALANGVRYGLACNLWTQNLNRAHRMAAALEYGIVWLNCWMLRDLRTPFGGMKDSGVGREGGWEALRFFTEPKNVCIKL